MRVLMLSPGFPGEMNYFARGLAAVGAEVIGVGDQPQQALPEMVQKCLSAYVEVRNLWSEEEMLPLIRRINQTHALDRIECLWEPGMVLAARLREELELPGLSVAQTLPFRDKEIMKQVLDEAGIRTPHHFRASNEDEIREAAEKVGFPLIIKPIAGAGSADTYRVNDAKELDETLTKVSHVPEMSVEEFIEGEEFTFDTICANREMLFENISWYRPRPLIARSLEWVSPQTINLRNLDRPELESGRRMGRQVLDALGFETGFTHMEWFLKADGEAVFGEIGARPPGGRSVDIMNFSCEADFFTGWAEAVCHGRLTQDATRRFNAAVIFKRAQGEGRIQRVVGLERILAEFGPHIVGVELLQPGEHRRSWKHTLLSDGFIFLRHTDLQQTIQMADRVGTDLQMFAG